MPTVFVLSHADLVMLAMACRTQAKKLREYAAATSSFSVKDSLLTAAKVTEEKAARFSEAAEHQALMWKIHRNQ